MLPKGAPGGSTRNVINRMSVQPALYDELAGTTPILTNPFKMRADLSTMSPLPQIAVRS